MKKAYEKPVFLAERFVAASSYAASACCVSKYNPFELTLGMDLCSENDNGHYVGGSPDATIDDGKGTIYDDWYFDNQYSNWTYATQEDNRATIFLDTACDFWWDPDTGNDGQVYVWNDVVTSNRSQKYGQNNNFWGFFKFFAGANPNEKQHSIAFEGTKVPQS